MLEALGPIERKTQPMLLPDWSYDGESRSLKRRFKFETFEDVMVTMSVSIVAADRMDHRPTWSNNYDILDIRLTTHDAGDVSMPDFDFARLIDLIVAETQNYHVSETENA